MQGNKLNRDILMTLLVSVLACGIVILGYAIKVVAESPTVEVPEVRYIYVDREKKSAEIEQEENEGQQAQVKIVRIEVEPTPETDLSEDDLEKLARCVHSEAGNQDLIGKRLVADVVLNRLDNGIFPDTVSEVIDQEGQFKCGSVYTDEDMEAVKMECQERLDHDVLYFKAGTFHDIGSKLYQHGAHYFSGR